MGKKVAVMTWFTYKNFGSVLQAGAVYNTLQNLGYEPYMINYMPKGALTEPSTAYLIRRCVDKVKSLLDPMYVSADRDRLFDEFVEGCLDKTKECSSYSELCDLNDSFDAFVCGSDQIWSPHSYDGRYFLDFVENTDKMIAYAPSLGSTKIADPVICERIAEKISRFEHLSVRERQGAQLIKRLTGKDARVVLDPTLLMTPSQWDAYVQEDKVSKIQDKDYIVCYFLGDSKKYMGYVRALSRAMGTAYYVIPVTMKQKKSKACVPFEVGVREFVSLIRGAKHVLTDSFHGMAFSVNYNVPFSVFKRFKDNDPKNQNSRIFNLLSMLGLEDRLVDYQDKQGVRTQLTCDFTKANEKLDERREDSLNYLKNALERAVSAKAERVHAPIKITDICCGCGACAAVCPTKAISIVKNEEGFEHCSIDADKCIGCRQCETVCPMRNITSSDMKDSLALYSVKSRSDKTLEHSSSGGVGHEIASYLLDQGYAVCGCAYDSSSRSAKHIWIMPDEIEKLPLLQGSKYIQSVTSDALAELVSVAEEYRVAFFGTPCQAAAVDKMLRKKGLRDKAIVTELICHGVPSYNLWDKYLSDLDKKHQIGKEPKVLFRSKEQKSKHRIMRIEGNGHIYKKNERKDDFYAFFRRGLCHMDSCLDCPYREHTSADIRIGDYWGDRFAGDKQGVSMVIANTQRAEGIIETLKQKQTCLVDEQDLSEYWSVQHPYNQKRPQVREALIEELKDGRSDLNKLRKKYCTYYDRVEKLGGIVLAVKRIVKRG